jgi:hypothetical protein
MPINVNNYWKIILSKTLIKKVDGVYPTPKTLGVLPSF